MASMLLSCERLTARRQKRDPLRKEVRKTLKTSSLVFEFFWFVGFYFVFCSLGWFLMLSTFEGEAEAGRRQHDTRTQEK